MTKKVCKQKNFLNCIHLKTNTENRKLSLECCSQLARRFAKVGEGIRVNFYLKNLQRFPFYV